MIQLDNVFCVRFGYIKGPVVSDYNKLMIILYVIQLSGKPGNTKRTGNCWLQMSTC